MKSISTLLLLSLLLGSCQSHHYQKANPHQYRYGQYRDLADAIKFTTGLRVVGFGRYAKIVDTRNPDNKSVQFMLNGVMIFDDYNFINDHVQMSRVQSIRIRKSVASRASTSNNYRTIVEIWTQ